MSNPSEIIRVALIDNEPIVREGIRSILKPHPTIVIVGEFNSIAQALTELPSLQADLALVAPEGEEADDLALALSQGRRRDMAAGRTLVGPHRTDLQAMYRAKAA